MTSALHRRAKQIRERALIRAWQYRQRAHASGVWFRVRRVLVDAAEAWAIDEHDAQSLTRAGKTPAAAGLELEPARQLFFVNRQQLEGLPSRRKIEVRLDAQFLAVRDIALVEHS